MWIFLISVKLFIQKLQKSDFQRECSEPKTGLENEENSCEMIRYLLSLKSLINYGCGTWNSTIETALLPGNQNIIKGSQTTCPELTTYIF